jgi:hypothetical protein
MKKYLGHYLLFLSLAIFGCKGEAHLGAQLSSSGTTVNVEIVKTKPLIENGIKKSLIYGSLVFEDLKKGEVKVNLTCISISIGNAQSEAIYIDSVAHILPDRYLLDNGEKTVDVYWKMDRQVELVSVETGLKVIVKEGCKLVPES